MPATDRPGETASSRRPRVGVYPGTFNPFTVGHLEVVESAYEQRDLDRVHLAVSRVPLAKDEIEIPTFEHRIQSLRDVVLEHPWLDLVVTDDRLLVDIADGYDVLIMGADKWHQIQNPMFYGGSDTARDEAMAALPELAVAPRPPQEVPADLLIDVPHAIHEVSSTAVRGGAHDWMHPAVAAFDDEYRPWSDPESYRRRFIDPATA